MAAPQKIGDNIPVPTLDPVQIVAAIIFAGESIRKTIPAKEAAVKALQCVEVAKVIIDATSK